MPALRESRSLRQFRWPRLPRLTAAELAIAVLFATNGLLFGGWIVRIPAIIDRLDVSTGTFGLILPAAAIGALLALPTSGKLAGRYGSARVLTAFSLARVVIVPLTLLVANPLWFAIGLFCYGFSNGALDVALNAQGVEVERAGRRSILSSLHGCSSLGSLVGSLVGGIAAGFGIGVMLQLTATCFIIGALTMFLFPNLVPDEAHAGSFIAPPRRKLFFLPPKVLLPFGAIALCAVVGEGGLSDWGTLYLRTEIGASASVAAFGYTAFAICMLSGRFMGDRIVRAFGEERTIRGASLVAGAGLLIAAGFDALWSGYLGFGLAGLGTSMMIPIAYRMAGNVPGLPRAQAVASAATIGYLGFLIGPLVLGTIGDLVSIRMAIVAIAFTVLLIQFIAHALRPAASSSSTRDYAPAAGTVRAELPVSR